MVRIRKPGEAAKGSTEPSAPAPRIVAPQVPLLYADAVGNVLMSPINTRVTFVLHTGPAKEGLQSGVPVLEVVIPTNALLGFITQLQEHVRTQGPGLVTALDETRKQFSKHFAQEEKK